MEEFTFLGSQLNTHFFLYQSENKSRVKISSQIYNVLIYDEFITNPNDNVVIYIAGKKNELVIIKHSDSPNNNIIERDNVEEFLPLLLSAERNDGYKIIYYCEGGFYEPLHCDIPDLPKELNFVDSVVINIITSKPIKIV